MLRFPVPSLTLFRFAVPRPPRVSSLAPVARCLSLQELYLRKNEVAGTDQIAHLSALGHLKARSEGVCLNPREEGVEIGWYSSPKP